MLTRRTLITRLGLASLAGMTGLARSGALAATEPARTYIGQIQAFGFDFIPEGWRRCEGQLLPVTMDAPFLSLFALFGARYGGDGRTSFGLPDLRGYLDLNWCIAYEGEYPSRSVGRYGSAASFKPILGQVQPFPYGHVPVGWDPCEGQMHQTDDTDHSIRLFSLIGMDYGGDSEQVLWFLLPDLREELNGPHQLRWSIALAGVDPDEAQPDQLLGQIQPFAHSYTPRGWARCDGGSLAIDDRGRVRHDGFDSSIDPRLLGLLAGMDDPAAIAEERPKRAKLPMIPDHLGLKWFMATSGRFPKRL